MMKRRAFAAGLVAAAGFALPLSAQGVTLGVVLMHGKQSSARKAEGLRDLSGKLQSGGAKVIVPDMPWSEGAWEKISLTPDGVFALIDGYAATLRTQGAQRIVVGGQSLGANMALAYAVARQNVAGVVMAAPGHNPANSYRISSAIKEAVDKAAALVQAGQGAQPFRGGDDNQGNTITISTTAEVYLGWLGPRGRASMPVQAPLLPATIPLMLVIGTKDVAFGFAEANIYRPAAKHPYSRYLTVEADHRNTDFAASARIAEWIKGLP